MKRANLPIEIPKDKADHLLFHAARIMALQASGHDTIRELQKFNRHAEHIFLVSFCFPSSDAHLNNIFLRISENDDLAGYARSLLKLRGKPVASLFYRFLGSVGALNFNPNGNFSEIHGQLIEAFKAAKLHPDRLY